MERYKRYMDDIAVPDELHERFRNPKKKHTAFSRVLAGAAAACLAFGLIFLSGMGENRAGSGLKDMTGAGADGSAFPGAGENGVKTEGDREEAEVITEAGKGAQETGMGDDREGARPEAGGAMPADGTVGVEGLPEAETWAEKSVTGCPAQEDFMKYLPVIWAEDFSGWEREEPEGDLLLRAEGGWAKGTKQLAVTVRIWEGEKEDGGQDLDREAWVRLLREDAVGDTGEIEVTFTEEGYRVSYAAKGLTGDEMAEILVSLP